VKPPPLKLSELQTSAHKRQKSQANAYKTAQHPLKSVTALGISQASSSLTLREEDLNESRSSTTTWRTATKTKPIDKKITDKVHAKKRFFLANKTGQGSVSVPT